ncbi:hypothetical protein EL22_02510 [Halostagnicola sp. A56]|uniref:DUF6517 family protein n=1 Tax=Halostagnicola sp. A56 TaxID=1495067 RepID=UPI0004A0702A|nr:DUF6517 family protein [Halostagnicola sp. A56]KDE58800.1 hypothetical protein EL22_02510 [Halostagnicola sp. A56]
MNRRSLLAGAAVLGTTSVAGCLGTFGMAEHEASPASVDESARQDTGYEQTGVTEDTIEQSVDLAVFSQEVSVTNYITEHEKSVTVGPLTMDGGGGFLVVATPQASVLGQELNPVSDMSPKELIERVEGSYAGMENVTHQEDGSVTILDQETTQSRFTANSSYNGSDVEVSIHISEAVETEEDLLVTVGVYPNERRDEEESNIISLMESVSEASPEDGESQNGSDDGGNESGSDGGQSDGGENGSGDGGIL